jgi:predicted Zn finger-like uncharacterized protein
MYTVCPKCALTLVVTAADLRVAQGYVRCGRCSNVFNALIGLTEERHPAPAPPPPEQPPQRREPASTTRHTHSEPTQDEVEAIPDSALEFNPAATDVTEVFVEPVRGADDDATGTFETIVLEAEDHLPPEDPQAPPRQAAARSETVQPDNRQTPDDEETYFDLDALMARTDAGDDAQTEVSPAVDDGDEASAPAQPAPAASAVRPALAASSDPDPVPVFQERPAAPGIVWTLGTVVLAILLAVQIVHHHRHELAANHRLNGPLTRLYGALGMPLVPRWNLQAYEVRQLGASADAAGTGLLSVRASIKNRGDQPQPLPLLRVIVQDRFGNRIAMRDVPPQAYLPRADSPVPLLSAGQRIDTEMAFVDPGRNAVGFEIDACLPAPYGGVACANDPGSR